MSIQVDGTYFHSLDRQASTQVSPRKTVISSVKPVKSQEAVAPEMLTTPKELKNTLKSKSSASTMSGKASSATPFAQSLPKPNINPVNAGLKRSREEADANDSDKPVKVAKLNDTGAQAPSTIMRKPKPKGNSLFIPKKVRLEYKF